MTASSAYTTDRLPLGGTVGEIVWVASSGLGRWTVVAVIPLLLHCLVVFVLIPGTMAGDAAQRPWDSPAVGIVTGLIYVAPATAWIRGIIAGQPPSGWQFHWGREELMYVLRGVQLAIFPVVLIGLIGGFAVLVISHVAFLAAGGPPPADDLAPSVLASTTFVAMGIGLVGLLMWLVADFILVLPAAANGDDSSFRRSAAMTRGYRWRVVAIGVVTSLAFTAVLFLIVFVVVLAAMLATHPAQAATGEPGVPQGLLAAADVIGVWLSTLVHATGLACIYRRLAAA